MNAESFRKRSGAGENSNRDDAAGTSKEISLSSSVKFSCEPRNKANDRKELYYKSLSTLKRLGYPSSQGIVDSAMSDIGALINLPPRLLGVLPSSRGLVAGDISLSILNAESSIPSLILDTKAFGNECCPIPGDIAALSYDKTIVKSSAQLVLIVEKDAIFQKIIDDGILEHLKPCLLITGRGYPDVSTRRLLHIIWKCLEIPIMALVDADPHGIEIMLVYRFGSLAMSKDADELAVPSVRWLGVHPSDIPNLGLPTQSLLPLGKEGTAKAEALLTRPYVQAHPNIYKEVAAMIKYQCKAEIEALNLLSSTYVTDVYIPGKLSTKNVF
ncbi:meiotic recombination protein SPO11 [Hetaerina americana]|uniref:meiotic recombination protein SPO11 n=1 Tax=Hetaerina americana TaxID=62018 RepID=UPI003A7F2683